MTSRAVGILARSRPTITPHGNALRVYQVRLKATETSQAAPTKQEQETLSWPRYLAVRKAKRRWELATMLPSTAASFISGLQYFGDHPPNFMGLDPLFLTIAATASCTGLGYLIGPLVGSSLWRLTHRRTMNLIEARDRDFHHHIVRNRVDPTRQSATNPVPDFYGEKIGSMKEYRQWLRDQARFRRKSAWVTEK